MMHSEDEFVTIHIGRSTWQGLKSELNPNYENPERIWAFPWYGMEGCQGQWDYFDTSRYYGTMVAEYIRADLYDALAKDRAENERLRSALRECEVALDLHGKMYPAMVKGYTLDALNAARAALRKEAYE